MNKGRFLRDVFILCVVILTITIGVHAYEDRRYHLISLIIVFLACACFYQAYEHRTGSIRRMVFIAAMTAIAVVGRMIFVILPGFKPVTAIIIISAVYMGAESGFLIGSLSAIVSNMMFGQGPWTPFQMFAWGTIGFIAGVPRLQRYLKKKAGIFCYGVFAGWFYSAIMDIWTVLSIDGTFHWMRFLIAQQAAILVTIEYMISNVIFLLLVIKPIGQKLERLRLKHGVF